MRSRAPGRHNRRVLLALDVGNTQTHVGVFQGEDLAEHWRFATESAATADELAVRVSSLLGLRGHALHEVESTAIASVVPQLSREYLAMCGAYLAGDCLMVSPGV